MAKNTSNFAKQIEKIIANGLIIKITLFEGLMG